MTDMAGINSWVVYKKKKTQTLHWVITDQNLQKHYAPMTSMIGVKAEDPVI